MTAVALRWEEILMPLLQKYKLNITWGDQDLLNIIFHHNPGLCNYVDCIAFVISVTYDTDEASLETFVLLKTKYQMNNCLFVEGPC